MKTSSKHTVDQVQIPSRTVTCLRCGYHWLTRKMPPAKPPMCPQCRDWYWDLPEEFLPATRNRLKKKVAKS